MLTFARIQDEGALDEFAAGFAQYVGVRLSLPYLRQGRVFGCFNDKGRLVGGYALITEPMLRGLGFLPDQIKAESAFLQAVPESMMMEINALWLAKSVTSRRDWLNFFRHLVKDTVACKKPYIIIYYSSLIKGLAKWYSYMGTTQLYKGVPKVAPGQTTHSELYIGYVSRARFSLWLWMGSFYILQRFSTKPRRGIDPKYAGAKTT